jgi:metal-dependent hydrolase (beta-lactamase superfamily II)
VGEAWKLIEERFKDCQGVVMEGTGALEIPGERYVVFVEGDTTDDQRDERNMAIAIKSGAIIDGSSHLNIDFILKSIRTFLVVS